VIGGSIALFSLLITHQLIWRAVEEISSKSSAPALWLAAEGLGDEGSSLLPSSERIQRLTTISRIAKIRLVAPPDRRITLTHGHSPLTINRLATGKCTAEVYLRKGTNLIKAEVLPDIADQSVHEEAALEIVYHPTPPASPWLVGAWVNHFEGTTLVSTLGFGEPESTVRFKTAPQPSREITTDRLGTFIDTFSIPEEQTEINLEVANPEAGMSFTPVNTMLVDATKAGMQLVDSKRPFNRQLLIVIGAQRYKFTATADIPRETEIRENLNAGTFLREVFGLCLRTGTNASDPELSAFACDFLSARTPVRFLYPHANNTTISFEFDHLLPTEPMKLVYEPETLLAKSFLTLPDDNIRVESTADAPFQAIARGWHKDGAALVWVPGTNWDSFPALRYGDLLLIGKEKSANTVESDATTPGAEASDRAHAEKREERAERLIDRIRRLEDIVPSKMRGLIETLLTAIPFLWFLWILNRYPPASRVHAATLRAVALTFLTLHLTILALLLFEASFSPTPLDFLRDLAPDKTLHKVANVLGSAYYIYPFLAIGVALLVDPVFRAFRRAALRPESPRRLSVLRGIAWLFFWIAVFTVPAATVWARVRIDDVRDVTGRLPLLGAVLSGGLLVIWFVLFWLLRGIFRINIRIRHAIRASWAMLLLPLVPPIADVLNSMLRQFIATRAQIYPLLLPERTAPHVSAAIVAILGALLLLQTGGLSLRLSQHVGAWRWFRSRSRLVLLLPLLVISIPVLGGNGEASIFTFTGFFYILDWLLPYALLIGGVVYIRLANPQDDFQLSGGELQLGALLFAWYVSGHSGSLLFIPIPFLIAWYMFRRWLLVTAREQIPSSASVLSKLLDERRARARSEDVEKGLNKKLSEGELKLSEYRARLSEAQEEARTASARLVIDTGGAAPHVLSKGPENGPYANARIAGLYGFLISVPFQVITLYGFVQRPYTNFPILEFTYALVFSVTTWVLMAAVFGYFYHLIRGRNGFEKALCFSLATVLPTLPLHLIAGESVVNRAQLLDVVQVVAFVLVLALVAFDFRTLHKQHRNWRDLLTLYGFASAAYGSTIVIAIASSLASKEILPKLWSIFEWLTGHSAH